MVEEKVAQTRDSAQARSFIGELALNIVLMSHLRTLAAFSERPEPITHEEIADKLEQLVREIVKDQVRWIARKR